jgi:hypothetical protein
VRAILLHDRCSITMKWGGLHVHGVVARRLQVTRVRSGGEGAYFIGDALHVPPWGLPLPSDDCSLAPGVPLVTDHPATSSGHQ